MAQDYDNIKKKLWADHAEALSRFVLDADDVEVLTGLRNLCENLKLTNANAKKFSDRIPSKTLWLCLKGGSIQRR